MSLVSPLIASSPEVMPPWRGTQSALKEFSKIIVKIGYKWACSFNPLFHTYRRKNSDVQFNPQTTTASTLNQILSSLQHAKDKTSRKNLRSKSWNAGTDVTWGICFATNGFNCPVSGHQRYIFRLPVNPNQSSQLFGHVRMASIWREEDHLGNLYTEKTSQVRMDPFQVLRAHLTWSTSHDRERQMTGYLSSPKPFPCISSKPAHRHNDHRQVRKKGWKTHVLNNI